MILPFTLFEFYQIVDLFTSAKEIAAQRSDYPTKTALRHGSDCFEESYSLLDAEPFSQRENFLQLVQTDGQTCDRLLQQIPTALLLSGRSRQRFLH